VHNRYAALVKGPSAIFPRGFLWLIPVWYAAVAVLLEKKGKTPSWYGPAALAGLFIAATTLLAVLATMRNNAFVADETGIWLGLRAGATRRLGRRRRAIKQLPWSEVRQLRVIPRYYGARLDVLLGSAAPAVRWPGVLRRIALACLLLILPVSYLFRSPGLLSARTDPHHYRIPLYDVGTAQLRLALAPLATPGVPIVLVPRWRSRVAAKLRRAVRRPAAAPITTALSYPPAATPPPSPVAAPSHQSVTASSRQPAAASSHRPAAARSQQPVATPSRQPVAVPARPTAAVPSAAPAPVATVNPAPPAPAPPAPARPAPARPEAATPAPATPAPATPAEATGAIPEAATPAAAAAAPEAADPDRQAAVGRMIA
jgi:hypothetical protein